MNSPVTPCCTNYPGLGPSAPKLFGGALAQPIFQGGRLRNNVRLTEAQKKEAVLVYQQTIQQAFRSECVECCAILIDGHRIKQEAWLRLVKIS